MDVEKQLSGVAADKEKVRRLFKHLVLAYQRRARHKRTVDEVHAQLAKVKQAAAKRAPKREVEREVAGLQEMISGILDQEKAVLSQQREETRMLLELRARLDSMEKRLLQQPMSAAVGPMRELHDINLALHDIAARLGIQPSVPKPTDAKKRKARRKGGRVPKRLKKVQRVIEKHHEQLDILKIEAQLKHVERRHRQLAKGGYTKDELKRLKTIIDEHKKRLRELKRRRSAASKR
jgi:hypothetical protein